MDLLVADIRVGITTIKTLVRFLFSDIVEIWADDVGIGEMLCNNVK